MLKRLIAFGKQTVDVSSHARPASSRILQSLHTIEVGSLGEGLTLNDSSC